MGKKNQGYQPHDRDIRRDNASLAAVSVAHCLTNDVVLFL
jgi:hypothetical protein